MSTWHVDFETYSEAEIMSAGAFRYAEHPSTEILFCAIARDDEDPVLWDSFSAPFASSWFDMCNDGGPIYAHNAQFEVAISLALAEKTFGLPAPDISRFRCTAAMCRRAAIPFSLDGAAEFLKLDQQKSAVGKRLISLFSSPTKGVRLLPTDDKMVTVDGEKVHVVDAWKMFGEYCVQDVIVEREIHRKLRVFDLTGDALEAFQFDLRMNLRGIPVNVPGVHNAVALVDEYQEKLADRFREITGLNPTQRDKVLAWVKERGYDAPDLTAASMEAFDTSKLTPEAAEALEIRQKVSYAAVKKLPSMLDCACRDGRIRGSLLWHGALRTGRWSGRLIQPQNMKRSNRTSMLCYDDICSGTDLDWIDYVYGPPLENIAIGIRHYIKGDRPFLDADYSQIEARVLAWLAGHSSLLQAFRDNKDLYKQTAVMLFGGHYDTVDKDTRFLGKIAALALGYQGGYNAFAVMAKNYGREIPEKLAKEVTKKFRAANQPYVTLWKRMQGAAVQAINDPGKWFEVNDKLAFGRSSKGGFDALFMRLPSGRRLYYPYPTVTRKVKPFEDPDTGEIKRWEVNEITYHGNIQGTMWGRVVTHGGVLTENACQAVAGDFLTHGLINAEKQGYPTFMVIHDQALCEYRPEDGHTVDGFSEALCVLPDWAKDFPLKAATDITPFYMKEVD